VIDTPGHEVFANLRRRGGGVADIAVLVIDVLKGFEAQTNECIDLLKSRKTPFLVVANKIDRIPGWRPQKELSFLESYKNQDPFVRQSLDEYLYSIMGSFSKLGFRSDRYDNINDFTQTIAVIPTSAKTGEGVSDLVAVLIGLTQQYLKDRLKVTKGPAKGTVLEVKEEVGLGITANVIIYDGVLRKSNTIVLGGKQGAIISTIRAVLLPKPLDEIRDPRDKFSSVEMVSAAAGVKIVAPNLEEVLAGAPFYAVSSKEEVVEYTKKVIEELKKIRISTEIDGVILKTDTLGSLEAIAEILEKNDVPIRLADVGDVSKRELIEAAVVKERQPLYGVVLSFNVKVLPDAEEEATNRKIPIFKHDIIYHLIDDYLNWRKREKEKREKTEFRRLTKPAKIKFLPGYIFRRAKPAIIGVEVLSGQIKPKSTLITKDGKEAGEILQIQDKGKSSPSAEMGKEVALSLAKVIVGRNINEGDILYVKIPEADIRKLEKFKNLLSQEEEETLDEVIQIIKKDALF
jgi:translation initiation factor 5B